MATKRKALISCLAAAGLSAVLIEASNAGFPGAYNTRKVENPCSANLGAPCDKSSVNPAPVPEPHFTANVVDLTGVSGDPAVEELAAVMRKHPDEARKALVDRLMDLVTWKAPGPVFIDPNFLNQEGFPQHAASIRGALENGIAELQRGKPDDSRAIARLYYMLGTEGQAPAWLRDGLTHDAELYRTVGGQTPWLKKILDSGEQIKRLADLIGCMSRWADTDGVEPPAGFCMPAADKDASARNRIGALKEIPAESGGEAARWQAFVKDMDGEAAWLIAQRHYSKAEISAGIAAEKKIFGVEPPPGSKTQGGGLGAGGVTGRPDRYGFEDLFGKSGDRDVFVHQYKSKADQDKYGQVTLSIRLISGFCGDDKNSVCNMIAIMDISNRNKPEGKVFPLDYDSDAAFALTSGPKARKFKLKIVTNKEGEQEIHLTDADEGTEAVSSSGKGPLTIKEMGLLRNLRAQQFACRGHGGDGLEEVQNVGGTAYYVMPQSATGLGGCHQLLPVDMVQAGATQIPSCEKLKSQRIIDETVNYGNIDAPGRQMLDCPSRREGGATKNDPKAPVKPALGDKTYNAVFNQNCKDRTGRVNPYGCYEIKEGEWPKPPDAAKPGTPGKPGEGNPDNGNGGNGGGQEPAKDPCQIPAGDDVPLNQVDEICRDRWVTKLKSDHVAADKADAGIWKMILMGAGANPKTGRDEENTSFMLMVLNNKALQFPGALLCRDDSHCVEESGGVVYIRIAQPEHTNGRMIATLNLGKKQTNPSDGRTQYQGNDGGYYSVKNQEVFEIPVSAIRDGNPGPEVCEQDEDRFCAGSSRAASKRASEVATEDAQLGWPMTVNLGLKGTDGAVNWDGRLDEFLNRYGKASDIFGPQQGANRQALKNYVGAQIAADGGDVKADKKWNPSVVVKLNQPRKVDGPLDRVRVAEYNDLLRDNHMSRVHPNCLFWGRRTAKDSLGIFEAVCRPASGGLDADSLSASLAPDPVQVDPLTPKSNPNPKPKAPAKSKPKKSSK